MSEVKQGLMYSESHEWAEDLGNGMAKVGISAHAQELLGDVVYVELPKVGTQVKAGDAIGVVESVKAASDIYSPVTGEIIEVNKALESEPNLINQDPYDQGWIFKVKLSGKLEGLMDANAYQQAISA
jgi:glycine cleavage system H protein